MMLRLRVDLYLFVSKFLRISFRFFLGNPLKSRIRLDIYLRVVEMYLSLKKQKYNNGISFSVIIPFHQKNRLPFLIRALKSIQESRYNCLEVIVVDQTTSLDIEYFSSIFTGELQILLSEKVSSSIARNLGKSVAKNEFLIFLDDDNFFHEKHFDLIERLIRSSEFSPVFYLGSVSDFTKTKYSYFHFFKYALLKQNLADTNTFVFHRGTFEETIIWDIDQIGCEDWRMLCDLVCAEFSVRSFPVFSVFLTSDAPNRVTVSHDSITARNRAVSELSIFLQR